MNKLKKLFGLLMSLMMLLAMGTTAVFAAGNDDGSITIKNTTIGKEYSAYKVFDLTYSTSDDATNVAYTYTKSGDADEFLVALNSDASPFTLTETTEGMYNVALKDGKTATDISTFLDENKGLLKPVKTVTAADSSLTISDLEYGYYFVTSEVGAVLTIDSTLPNVEVIDKNQKPDWDNGDEKPGKVIIDANGNKVTENTVNYGDVVNFSAAINATSYVGDKQVTYYYITDTLAEGFDKAENITVYVNDKQLENTDYTLVQNGNTFQVTVPYKDSYGSNFVIDVQYSARVNNVAILAEKGNDNTANFTYSTKTPGTPTPDPETDPKYPDNNEKVTKTYVYALGIVKVDPEGNVLTGAEFSVTDANGDVIWATGSNGVYEYCQEGTTGAVNQFTTDDKGVLVIKGVKAGKYTVTEKIAPKGYNLLKDSVIVEAVMKEEYTKTITTYIDENGKVTTETTGTTKTYETSANVSGLVVVNNAGTELPSTGGVGTTLFYVFGGLLVATAGVLLVVKKRMSHEA